MPSLSRFIVLWRGTPGWLILKSILSVGPIQGKALGGATRCVVRGDSVLLRVAIAVRFDWCVSLRRCASASLVGAVSGFRCAYGAHVTFGAAAESCVQLEG